MLITPSYPVVHKQHRQDSVALPLSHAATFTRACRICHLRAQGRFPELLATATLQNPKGVQLQRGPTDLRPMDL